MNLKKIIIVPLVISIVMFASCAQIQDSSNGETDSGFEISDTTSSENITNSNDDTSEDIVEKNTESDSSIDMEPDTFTGIELVNYPNPHAISEYEKLTDNQKIAFDALAEAIIDIEENGPIAGKIYPLAKRVSKFDYLLVYDIMRSNFGALESLIGSIFRGDTMGTLDYVDYVFVHSQNKYLDKYYQEYLESEEAAERILSSIEHDGTEPGIAYAIAEWLMINITYPPDYKNRVQDYLNSVHTALTTNEAICGGYAKAFDFLCKKAGLETIYVSASSVGESAGHAWNIICVEGNWYHIDTTWMNVDDPLRYFMISDEVCYQDHNPATYYWDREKNEKIIPKASKNFPHGAMFFDTASDAWDYVNNDVCSYESFEVYFYDINEMNNFIDYNGRYVKRLQCYMFVKELDDNIIKVYFL